jgi:hypothetical protein
MTGSINKEIQMEHPPLSRRKKIMTTCAIYFGNIAYVSRYLRTCVQYMYMLSKISQYNIKYSQEF